MKFLSYVFYTIVAIVVAYVALSNMESVKLTLVPENLVILPPMVVNVPLFVVILGSLVVGVILAYFLVFGRAFAANRAKTKAETACRKAEAELEKLKRKTGETDDDVLAILK